ncbi:MAG: DUF1464 family protein [Archaeoglobaceae archaeon]
MVISAGVDAGTKDYEVVVIKGRDYELHRFESEEVKESPHELIELLQSLEADAIAGLSGYGLPIKRFSELSDRDVFLMTLNLDSKKAIGLRSLIREIRKRNMNFYTIPGVVHLPTIPKWRKFNKIDIGTYDKVCSAVLAVLELSEEKKLEEQNFLLAEVGYGFTSVLAIKSGKIVDALGGTSGFMGYSSLGSMDAELAYLLGEFPKGIVFSGGVKDYVLENNGNEIEILSEYVLKALKAIELSVGEAEICFLSGRFAKEVETIARDFYETRILHGFCDAKQSAQGAAIVANAIANGEYRKVVEHMEIFNARGSVFDHLSEKIRSRVLERISKALGSDMVFGT